MTQIGVFTTDTQLVIRVWDATLARLTGISEESALGRDLTALLPDLEKRGLLKRFQRSLKEGVVEVLAPAFHHYLIPCAPVNPSKHFEKMQQRVTIAPLRDGDTIAGLIVTVEDVTDRLEHERELSTHLAEGDEAARLQGGRRDRAGGRRGDVRQLPPRPRRVGAADGRLARPADEHARADDRRHDKCTP